MLTGRDRVGGTFKQCMHVQWAFQAALVVKNMPSTGDMRDTGLIPGSGRSPGGGNGNLLQYSCQENPTDRGTWQAHFQRVRND